MSTRQEIRGALQTHLLALGGMAATGLENVKFDPPADGSEFQRVATVFAEPRTYSLSGSSQERGFFQIELSYKLGVGAGVPDARAKAISDHFPFVLTLPVGGPMKVKIMRKAEINRLGPVNGRDVTIIRIRFSDR